MFCSSISFTDEITHFEYVVSLNFIGNQSVAPVNGKKPTLAIKVEEIIFNLLTCLTPIRIRSLQII